MAAMSKLLRTPFFWASLGACLFVSLGRAALPPQAELLTGAAPEIETVGKCEVDTFRPGTLLFTDRTYVVKECPAHLNGKLFIRSSIGHVEFRALTEGVLTLVSPLEGPKKSRGICDQIEARGFVRILQPELFQLFGAQPFDQVHTYQKLVKKGERFSFGKWAVVIGFAKATAVPAPGRQPWSENKGELLYNGIRLPEDWPPQNIDPHNTEPMPVPYLASPPAVIPVDVGRQLFVDNFLVQQTDLQRQFHLPVKYEANPVLKPETALEVNTNGNALAGPKSGGLWWDAAEQVFKFWYEAGWLNTICYATSRDGLHWDRPNLDILPGSNRVLPLGLKCDSWTVVPDYWTKDPQQKYKLFVRPPGRTGGGVSLVSPDGIHWTNQTPTGPTGDRSTMFYNPFRQKWVYSLRSAFRGRSRHYWEHEDFLAGATWNSGEPVVWAAVDKLDLPDPDIKEPAQLYNLDAVAYESLMLGFYEIHLGPNNDLCAKVGLPKITELNFAYSRDGFHWSRPDRRPAIRAERRDVWDRGYVQSLGNLCCVRGDQLWFYYIGFQGNTNKLKGSSSGNGMYDRAATGVAFLRRDGFASMDAGTAPGTLTTRPLRFSGTQLFVNAAGGHGELRAEMLGEDGRVIEPFTTANCAPVRADSTIANVAWKGAADLSALRERPVRIRFTLTNGSLYSFWVSRDHSGRSDGYVAGGGPGFTGPTDTVGVAALAAEKKLIKP